MTLGNGSRVTLRLPGMTGFTQFRRHLNYDSNRNAEGIISDLKIIPTGLPTGVSTLRDDMVESNILWKQPHI